MIFSKSAYAKINLDLTLTGEKTDNGYHLLNSTFVAIDLYAGMEIEITSDPLSFVSQVFVNGTENNKFYTPIIKAVELWSKKREYPVTVKVEIKNPIPYKAGLGASSSYAAQVLLSLEEYYVKVNKNAIPLDNCEMQSIAVKIGADVPFFVSKMPCAYIEGIGEIISPISNVPEEYLLHFPNYNISTPEAYEEADREKISRFIDLRQNKMYYNYLVGKTGTKLWRLSGSGSTFFIPSPSKAILKKAALWGKEGIETRVHMIID